MREVVKGLYFILILILNGSKLGCRNEEAELRENQSWGLAGML